MAYGSGWAQGRFLGHWFSTGTTERPLPTLGLEIQRQREVLDLRDGGLFQGMWRWMAGT